MSFQLVIAEKPSVARSIATVIGATEKQNGYWQGGGYLVSWCIGHLVSFAEAGQYDEKYCKWKYEDLPILPQPWQFIVPDEKKQQFEIVRSLLNRPDVDSVTAATDAGREGELIFRFVYQMAGCTKPVKRLWISSMEDAAIREGFANLRPDSDYDALYQSALCRAKADWLVGINATRLFSVLYHKTLTVGRVQTPTLKMLVDRDAKILRFQKEKYYTVGIHSGSLKAGSGRISDAETANSLKEKCTGAIAVCTSVKREKKTEQPPKLYDLTTLQREANRLFGFTAKQTLDYAQQLYEKKLLTYPRTDSQYLTEDMGQTAQHLVSDLLGLLPFAQGLDLTPEVGRILNSKKVSDHHAIIPTGVIPQGLSDNERHVYDLVARRFISVFYPDCQFATTTVMGKVGDVEFKATGKEILQPGWRVVYALDQVAEEAKEKDDEEKVLPAFVKGETGPHEPTLTEKQTTPPKYYTEATLLRAMETAGKFVEDEVLRAAMKENGIGRPSSRAGIIETLFKRHYIRRQRKNLMATPTGIQLIETIREKLLTSCELTGIWEKKLRDIERKNYDAAQFVNELKDQVAQIVSEVLADSSQRHIAITTDEDLKKTSKKKASTKGKISAKEADSQKAGDSSKEATSTKVESSAKEPVSSKEETSQKKGTSPKEESPDPLVGQPCPVCHQGHIIKGKTAYGCSRWREGCTYRQPFNAE